MNDEMTVEQRIIQYRRDNKCEHKLNISDWPPDLVDSYSRDPYAHIAHLEPHRKDKCECQMCLLKIGQFKLNAEW